MDLMCEPVGKVGLMVSAYYICNAAGGVFYTVPEKIGRKKTVMIASFGCCLA